MAPNWSAGEGIVGRRNAMVSEQVCMNQRINLNRDVVAKLHRVATLDRNQIYELIESTDSGVDKVLVFEYEGKSA